jgi:hypothetical protein
MSNVVRLLVLWFLGATSIANACISDPRNGVLGDVDASYASSDAVFTGEVVGVVPISTYWVRVTIRVIEQFKGRVDEHVSLAANMGLIGCSPHAEPGIRYIVFARNRPTETSADPILPGDVATASPATVTPVEAPTVVNDTVASSPEDAPNQSRGNFFIDNPTIANLRGADPSAGPSVPWDGDFILDVTVEVDSTYEPYSERIRSALDKLRALRADEEKGGA